MAGELLLLSILCYDSPEPFVDYFERTCIGQSSCHSCLDPLNSIPRCGHILYQRNSITYRGENAFYRNLVMSWGYHHDCLW